jgi:hypothetical protein
MKHNMSTSRSSQNRTAPIEDALLEQWLAEALDASAGKRSPLNAQANAILSMVDRVRDTLVPIQPSPHFVRDLGYHLVETASRGRQSLLQRYRTAIVIGVAAAGSVASVVGVTVLVLRQKNRRTARSL